MDKYFLKKRKQVKTAIFLTDEEINKIKQLPDITQIIEIAYKAGYENCHQCENHDFEIRDMLDDFDYINSQLLIMQRALTGLTNADIDSKLLGDGFFALYKQYATLRQKMNDVVSKDHKA